MEYSKQPLSHAQLIELLKERGLLFYNEEVASSEFKMLSYFRLAYYGLHQGLRETSSAPTAISPLPYGKPSATHVVAETYYNLQGQRITSSAADSIYITSQLMSDGSVRNKKVINR